MVCSRLKSKLGATSVSWQHAAASINHCCVDSAISIYPDNGLSHPKAMQGYTAEELKRHKTKKAGCCSLPRWVFSALGYHC
jgi:hypothetical protein